MAKEFIEFLKTYGIIGLAIAVIIGGKLNELVGSFVNDLLMPLIFAPALRAANVDNIRLLNYNGILYGKFLGALLDFGIVALVVFLIAKYLFKEEKVVKK
ncbi:MAG: MscL family protein [Bdellovibrionota bacterium]